MSTSGIERRKDNRIKFNLEVSTKGTTTGYLESFDISPFGMFLKTSNPLPLDSKLFISFTLPESPIPMKAYGRVAWINSKIADDDQPDGMGIHFLNISAFDRKRLEKFLDSQDLEIKINSDEHTLLDFSHASEESFEVRSKELYAYINDMKEKGYYTYRRPIASATDNRVLVRDDNTGEESEMIMMGSNSYLGLSSHPKVIEAVNLATKKYGVGAASAPMLAGTFELHRELELKIAKLKSCEDAIVFPSGYATNVGTISCLLKKKDIALIDRLCHASIIDGCLLGNTTFRTFKHSDLNDLERLLLVTKGKYEQTYIMIEGIYSMDGDIVPLPDIVKLAKKFKAKIMIDDAHATGVIGDLGKGTTNHFNLEGEIDIVMGTMSKAIGQLGGFIASSKEVVNYLRHYARSYFFATSLPPIVIASSLASIEVMLSEPELIEKLWDNIRYFKKKVVTLGFNVIENSDSAIVPIIIGDESILKPMSRRIHEEGIYLNPVPYPAVPKEQTRFRATIMATHTKEDLDETLKVLDKVGKEFGIIGNNIKQINN